jgi:poly(3-hydroxybutyrate) depolymerase
MGRGIVVGVWLLIGCAATTPTDQSASDQPVAGRQVRQVTSDGVTVTVIIDRPALGTMDALVVYHGSVQSDRDLLSAATTTLDTFKGILDRQDMLLVSVLYPQENVLFGDGIRQAEAALLWVKRHAGQDLGIRVGKVFLAGHSQGGYMVTRLNTMHPTNGVIANAPGPLDLVYRCQLEESGQILASTFCATLRRTFGPTTADPGAYQQRSLMNFVQAYTSDILFVQGLNDSPIQMHNWPNFKAQVTACEGCRGRRFVEIPGGEHGALFTSASARSEFNAFIASR